MGRVLLEYSSCSVGSYTDADASIPENHCLSAPVINADLDITSIEEEEENTKLEDEIMDVIRAAQKCLRSPNRSLQCRDLRNVSGRRQLCN